MASPDRSVATAVHAPVHARWVRAAGLAFVTAGLLLSMLGLGQSSAQDGGTAPVHVVEISGEIDLGLAPYLDRALEQAQQDAAAAVLLDIDTPGGRLDAVLQMRDALLRTPVRTIAFVDPTAFSAGALVTIAANEIYMAPEGVVGAAAPVTGEGIEADAKVVAAVRSTFRSTAEQRDRDPEVAAAMVDSNIEIDGLVARGELVSLTTSEAQEWGYTDGVASTREEVLEQAGLADAPVVEVAQSWAERFVRFITNPVLSGLFLLAGWLLIVGDMGSGGIGAGTGLGSLFLAAFFWGHLVAGLAGWEDVALVVIGLLLILIELLVVPGFGVFGILGLAALLGGSFLAMLNRDWDFVGGDDIVQAGTIVGLAFVGVVVLLATFVRYLSRRDGPRGLVLRSQLASTTPATQRSVGWLGWFGDGGVLASDLDDAATRDDARRPEQPAAEVEGDAAAPSPTVAVAERDRHRHGALQGATGVALSDLRPAGVADIDGRRVDVVTEGEYIAAGELVEVTGDEGYRRVVRRPRD